nr:UDP-N-acetylmuramoyl-L-alanine--D-glutamate ligase [uncultured Sphingomonas sp.]
MITARAFSGKHYAVLGLARSGLATVNALLASGAKVTAWDDREEARSQLSSPGFLGEGDHPKDGGGAPPSALRAATSPANAGEENLVVEDFTDYDLSRFDSIVVTPGLPLNRHPIAARAKEAGVEIIGDIELFARARPELPPHKVVGITGTNGKSTTTALVHHILKTAGVPTEMGGNIGLPILAQEPLPEGGVYVLELSSYQIDLTKSLDCDVAVLLNITPDHLDRYESFEAYAASKARLLEMQGSGSAAVLGISDANTIAIHDRLWDRRGWGNVFKADVERFNVPTEFWDYDDLGGLCDWPALQGPHNAQNAIAATMVCSLLQLDDREIEQGLRTYPGLPHRMERIRDLNGVLYVNDSKATNAEAAAPALAAYPRIRWIVGGLAKAETLGDTAKYLGHVVKAYTIGEAGPMFARLLREAGVDVLECETLENAVKRAAEDSHSGETVLLSPASASFDQFRDFEARGDAFRKAVGEL